MDWNPRPFLAFFAPRKFLLGQQMSNPHGHTGGMKIRKAASMQKTSSRIFLITGLPLLAAICKTAPANSKPPIRSPSIQANIHPINPNPKPL
jgi:hypothetical protein